MIPSPFPFRVWLPSPCACLCLVHQLDSVDLSVYSIQCTSTPTLLVGEWQREGSSIISPLLLVLFWRAEAEAAGEQVGRGGRERQRWAATPPAQRN